MEFQRKTRTGRASSDDTRRRAAIREKYQREKPTPEQLASSGDYAQPVTQGQMLDLMALMQEFKRLRTEQGLSLADLSESSGMDRAALSRLENGQVTNPTISTLDTLAAALGATVHFVLETKTER